MSNDLERLAQRVASLESRLAEDKPEDKKDEDKKEDKKEASEREMLASEIDALEARLAADEDEAEEKELDKEQKDEKKASLVDKGGVEEKITQESLSDVEDLEHGTELTTDDSMLDAAPTGYVARLKKASARLDNVAGYLEKTGRKQLAFRIDKISDSIDARVAKIEEK